MSDTHALATNVAYFARALRRAGIRTGPSDTVAAVEALIAGGVGTREEFYWTLHSVLVTRHEDTPVFDEAFRMFWRSPDLVAKMIKLLSPAMRAKDTERDRAGANRAKRALSTPENTWSKKEEPPEIQVDARLTASGREVLRSRDFAQMTAEEIAAAKRALATLALEDDRLRMRRRTPSPRGRIDMRRTLRRAARVGGDVVIPLTTAPKEMPPPIVVLADISGSMADYTRLFLHFVHALTEVRTVETFLFGTRLTRATRQLRGTDPDEALEAVSRAVPDWAGGTRMAACLAEFNKHWSRRLPLGRATVLLVTDGLEREDADLLSREGERLALSCRRFVWLNPLLRFEGFEARAGGVRALLPHVDEFRSAHSLASIEELCDALGGGAAGAKEADPRRWLAAGRAAA